MSVKRILGPALGLVLLVGVVAGVLFSGKDKATQDAIAAKVAGMRTVKLLTGSAKFPYLQDPRVQAVLEKEGLRLELTKTGSFADDVKRLAEFDAVWPAGINAADDFAKTVGPQAKTFYVFSTPLAVASWSPLAKVFASNGLAAPAKNGTAELNMTKLLDVMTAGKRWNQLANNEQFNTSKRVLINVTDLRKSNTGLMYLSLLSAIKNQGEPVDTLEKADKLGYDLAGLLTGQGYQEGTLQGPFEDYLAIGMGKAPLVLVYEAQYVEALQQGKLKGRSESEGQPVLFYPKPGLVIKHTAVSRSPAGEALGNLLASNAELQKIAAEYGFRGTDTTITRETWKKLGFEAPALYDLVEPPTSRVLAAFETAAVRRLNGQ